MRTSGTAMEASRAMDRGACCREAARRRVVPARLPAGEVDLRGRSGRAGHVTRWALTEAAPACRPQPRIL